MNKPMRNKQVFLLIAGWILYTPIMGQTKLNLDWELGYPGKETGSSLQWTEATVPGAVQLDIARAEGYGTYYYAENWKDYRWMEDTAFTYRTVFGKPEMEPGERLLFRSLGIDYAFQIRMNGRLMLEQEGMFSPVRLDVTSVLEDKNELLVKILPVPKKHPFPEDRTQAASSVKPAVSYGWDWHPRLVPSGIWDSTFLEILPASHLEKAEVTYTLDNNLSEALLLLQVAGRELEGSSCTWKLYDPEGELADVQLFSPGNRTGELQIRLREPLLWWPWDLGDQALYTWTVELADRYGSTVQTLRGRTGFRRVKLVMNEGAWREPAGFPKTRSVVPMQLEINGREIFCRGTNWVNPEIFPGIITPERYGELIDRAAEAHFNMLRIWGGGPVNKESFYDLCDEKGILVWQEFPLACNNYEATPPYLEVLEREADAIIRKVRKHPCLVIWSGGNELFNSWSGMTDQSLAVRLLNSRCLDLDPMTPFISTSPLFGVGHGHYVFRDMESGEEVYSLMNRAHFTAYTEFGMPAPSPVEVLKSIIPPEELWPPAPGTSWESHHGFNAWVGETWLMQGLIEDYFGESASLEELVEHGQLLQCEGYKAIYEEARRQKPYCSMALNWCFNEPWPTAANNSLVNWPNRPKPAFFAVRDASRPVLASARNTKFQWERGEKFTTHLWILNDRHEPVPGAKVSAWLVSGEEELLLGEWESGGAGPDENIEGPVVSAVIPDWPARRFHLELRVKDRPGWNSGYLFLLKP